MSRWLRLVHRWLAPIFILVMIAVIGTQGSAIASLLQRVQQVMVVIFALTGLYFFVLPWWAKSRHARRRRCAATSAQT